MADWTMTGGFWRAASSATLASKQQKPTHIILAHRGRQPQDDIKENTNEIVTWILELQPFRPKYEVTNCTTLDIPFDTANSRRSFLGCY